MNILALFLCNKILKRMATLIIIGYNQVSNLKHDFILNCFSMKSELTHRQISNDE